MSNTLFGQLEDRAIGRMREFENAALNLCENGYHLSFSGGKDSVVILELAKRAGIKFTAHHYLTTCDPPELVYFVRTHPEIRIEKPKMTMWQLIRKKGMPPRRNARFCCEVLKEGNGAGRIIITGVRWAESNRRAKRRMFEAQFRRKRTWMLHPIIDWTEHDVWNFIRKNRLSYCRLYDEGFKRLGCVLCPMKKDSLSIAREMQRWPRLAQAWEKAIKATYKPDSSKRFKFSTPQEYWEWWLDRDRKAIRADDNQCMMMFED